MNELYYFSELTQFLNFEINDFEFYAFITYLYLKLILVSEINDFHKS